MRMKFFAIAGAISMAVTSTAAIAAAPFAGSQLDQRPSQLQVSKRKGEKLEDGNSAVTASTIVAIVILASVPTFVVTKLADDGTSPS